MKYFPKGVVSWILIIIFLGLSGCSDDKAGSDKVLSDEDTYIENQDYQYMFSTETNETNVAKGNGGYYTYINSFIYYIDADSLQATPLCNKSDCRHDKETDYVKIDECNAYVPTSPFKQLYFYEDNLYMIHESYITDNDGHLISKDDIIRISPDGSLRKEIISIENEFILTAWLIHRGNIFYISRVGEGNTAIETLYKMPLSNPENKVKLMTSEDIGYFGTSLGYITAYGNHIYINAYGYASENDYLSVIENSDDENSTLDITTKECFVNYDIQTDKFTLIDGDDNESIIFEGFCDNKFFYHTFYDNAPSNLMSVDLDGENLKDIHAYSELYERYRMDEKYFYSYNMFDDRVYDREKPEVYTVYDKEWNKITDITLPYIANLSPGDEKYIFDLVYSNSKISLYAIDKTTFETDNTEAKLVFETSNN